MRQEAAVTILSEKSLHRREDGIHTEWMACPQLRTRVFSSSHVIGGRADYSRTVVVGEWKILFECLPTAHPLVK